MIQCCKIGRVMLNCQLILEAYDHPVYVENLRVGSLNMVGVLRHSNFFPVLQAGRSRLIDPENRELRSWRTVYKAGFLVEKRVEANRRCSSSTILNTAAKLSPTLLVTNFPAFDLEINNGTRWRQWCSKTCVNLVQYQNTKYVSSGRIWPILRAFKVFDFTSLV